MILTLCLPSSPEWRIPVLMQEGDLAGRCIYTDAKLAVDSTFPVKPTSTTETQFLQGWQDCSA